MNETIKLILSLSLSGSILALLIFALKPLFKHKLSKSIQYYIWLVVLLRLVLPFSFEGSIMNEVFYGDKKPFEVSAQRTTVQHLDRAGKKISNTLIIPNVQETVVNGVNYGTTDHTRSFRDLFINQYALYLWLLGFIIVLAVNLSGYARFSKHLKQANMPVADEEKRILASLWNGRNKVRLVRNRFVTTPMLMGIIRPCIILPNLNFNEVQLKNILRHELVHLRRFDIAVKWLTMIAVSVHWFNPLMYFMKKEINHACELACDEAVIKGLNSAEKQAYGDTLISVVAEHQYPLGVLQATMCEEKKSLKERLVAIMKYSKKSRLIILFSGILLGAVVLGALFLGAGVGVGKGVGKDTPPNLYIGSEKEETKVALRGTYDWSYRGKHIHADADHPVNFEYNPDNIVSVRSQQQLIISTQKLKADKKYDFTLEQISVYKDGQLVELETVEPSYMKGDLYLQAPAEAGEYIYVLSLNFKDKGTVNYGFVVRADLLTYDLAEISKYKTPYLGHHTKVLSLVSWLPVPDNYFKQQFISMETKQKPYGLTIFYEPASASGSEGGQFEVAPDTVSELNALVVFCMIDNLDEVTFAFRDSQSDGKLDTSKYDATFTFSRASLAEKYGDLAVLAGDLHLLQDVLTEKTNTSVVTYEIVNFADEQVEIAGEKLNYKAGNLGPLYDKIGEARVEQMMYRAVVFYKAAFTHDFDTVNRLANEQLKDELKRWADNTSKEEDSSAMPIMKLDNYTDVDFPIGISAPRLHPIESDRYMVMLEISEKMKAQIYFEVPEKGEPLVEGFSLK